MRGNHGSFSGTDILNDGLIVQLFLSRDIFATDQNKSFCTLLIILDSETFHDNLFFTIVTAAIAEIQPNYKKYAYFEMS